ncbi:hypothetical protein H7I42_25395 [Mycolicibacterium vanbaalenii PYR-1]|nr:hypothetical protein [Mycolicibacterium vanbaalenii PYR-1]
MEACEAQFQECLDRGYSDPDYGVVHHLTVGAYMLSHGRQLDENIAGTELRLVAARQSDTSCSS